MAILPRVEALPLVDRSAEAVASAFFGERGDSEGRGEGREDVVACEEASLEALYPELAPRILRFQRDLLGDATLAIDATQETFIRAFRKVRELPAGTRLAPWVFGIARHVSMELRRARGRFRRVVVDTTSAKHLDVPDGSTRSPEAYLLDREALTIIERALAQLTEERRAVLLMRLDHGLAYDDIARLMGWSLPKVKVEIFRAREVLRAAMDSYRGGVP